MISNVLELKPLRVRLSLNGTCLDIRGGLFLLKEGGSLESVSFNPDNFTTYALIEVDSKSVWIDNKDGRLDMEWILAEHQRNVLRRQAVEAIRGACDDIENPSSRLADIKWLEYQLYDEKKVVEYFIRNMLTAEILGEVKDLDGAIRLAKEVNPFRTAHILEDRIKKILPK